MSIVNVHQAKTHLSRLLAQMEAGEDVVIARDGEPVARLVPCKPAARRQPDVLKGKIAVPDSFFDPLPEDELAAWEGRLIAGPDRHPRAALVGGRQRAPLRDGPCRDR